jgi:RNA polymerase sigma-70 factor (ECF subfamily)
MDSTISRDRQLLEALRRGDEAAFREVVEVHHPWLRRLARLYVPASEVDDVVQETWIGVIRGIATFEGRSSLRTWILRILVNQARRRAGRGERTVPFSASGWGEDPYRGAVTPERLTGGPLGPGYWSEPPAVWNAGPEGRLLGAELRRVVAAAISRLPPPQREVITLRDVEGWTSAEVCEALGISQVNQRVRLHRARTAVRDAVEVYLDAV